MVKCVFCGKEENSFKGMHIMRNEGSVSYFCSSKCRRNSDNLKRDRRKIRWTEAFHITRDKARVREEARKKKESEKKKSKEDSNKKK